MIGKFTRTLSAITLSIGGCGFDPQVGILYLEPCEPNGISCFGVADGISPSYVVVKVQVDENKERKKELKVKLRLSRGSWAPPDDVMKPAEKTIDLGPTGVASASFVPDSTAAPIVIEAALGDVKISQEFPLAPSPLSELRISSEPPILPDTIAIDLPITAEVVAVAGKVSPGTAVTFRIASVEPASGFAELTTTEVAAGTDGKATVKMRATAETTSVVVEAEARPPEVAGFGSSGVVTAMRTFSRRPPPPVETVPAELVLGADPPQFPTRTISSGKIVADVATMPVGRTLDGSYYVDFEIIERDPVGAPVELSAPRAFFDGTKRTVEVQYRTGSAVRSFTVSGKLGRRTGLLEGALLTKTVRITDDRREIGVADLSIAPAPAYLSDDVFAYVVTVALIPPPNGLIPDGASVALRIVQKDPPDALAVITPDLLYLREGPVTATLVAGSTLSSALIEGSVVVSPSTTPVVVKQCAMARPN